MYQGPEHAKLIEQVKPLNLSYEKTCVLISKNLSIIIHFIFHFIVQILKRPLKTHIHAIQSISLVLFSVQITILTNVTSSGLDCLGDRSITAKSLECWSSFTQNLENVSTQLLFVYIYSFKFVMPDFIFQALLS
jgi:hypothetical protein